MVGRIVLSLEWKRVGVMVTMVMMEEMSLDDWDEKKGKGMPFV